MSVVIYSIAHKASEWPATGTPTPRQIRFGLLSDNSSAEIKAESKSAHSYTDLSVSSKFIGLYANTTYKIASVAYNPTTNQYSSVFVQDITSPPGTLYWVIGATSGWSTPTAAQITQGKLVNDSTAPWYGDEEDPGTDGFVLEQTGITDFVDDTSYTLAWVWTDGVYTTNIATYEFTHSTGNGVNITLSNSTQANTSSTITVSQNHSISLVNSTQANTSSTITVSQNHSIGLVNSTQTNTSSEVTAAIGSLVSIVNSTQANASSTITISQNHSISLVNSTQANTSSTITVSQNHSISLVNGTQANTSSTITVSQNHSISLVNSTQTNTSSTVTVTPELSKFRPNQDILTTGWSAFGTTDLYDALNEESYDDGDYIISPDLSSPTPVIFQLNGDMSAGSWNIKVRARKTSTNGQLRAILLDSAQNPVATSIWHSLSDNFTTESFYVSNSNTARYLKLEVQ